MSILQPVLQSVLQPALSLSLTRAGVPRLPLFAAVIGDSIDNAWDFSFFSRLCLLSDEKLRFYVNAGIGGNNTTQMLARIQTDVIAYAPRVCVLGSTTNDYPANIPVATTRSNITSMVSQLVAAGIRPILRLTTPTDNAGSGDYSTVDLRRAAVQAHNDWITQYAADNGFDLLDVYTPLADASGGYLPGYTTDGTHPTPAAADYVAGLLAGSLPPSIAGSPAIHLVGSAAESNLFPSGFITTTSGWANSGSPALSLDTAYPGDGDGFKLAITADQQLVQRSIMAATMSGLIGKNLELAMALYGKGCRATVVATQRTSANAVISQHYLTYQMTLIDGRIYKPRASFKVAANCSNVLFTVKAESPIDADAFLAFAQITGRDSPVGGP